MNPVVEVIVHPNLNVSRYVISCFNLIEMSEQDILKEMFGEIIIHVQPDRKKVNTAVLILTLAKITYPNYIEVSLLHVSTCLFFFSNPNTESQRYRIHLENSLFDNPTLQ